MENQRTGDTTSTLSCDHHNMPYNTSFLYHSTLNMTSNQEPPSHDFGELEEAIVLQGVKMSNDESVKSFLYSTATIRPAATLEMFPSWPTKFHYTQRENSKSRGGEQSGDSNSVLNTINSRNLEVKSLPSRRQPQQQQFQKMTRDSPRIEGSHTQSPSKSNYEKRKGAGSTADKVTDAKTLRRLAQNREAARKSRLRKKAYVQQLETSRIKLAQLEQELQKARSQGLFMGGGVAGPNISSGASMFEMEYSRWLDDDERQIIELRRSLQSHLGDVELRVIVDAYIVHYDQFFRLKGIAAKADVFHIIAGIWATPAERCFLWIGGFRPSSLIKMLIAQLDPLTQQQVVGIYSLQHSSQQAEEAVSQGLKQLQQSIIEIIATSCSVNDTMHHMAIALDKLANLESFVSQADNLRQQTLHQLRRILTIRQAARCFMMIGEYYGRLRALSSLWASRPRETMMVDDNSCQTTIELQMIQASQHHFSNM